MPLRKKNRITTAKISDSSLQTEASEMRNKGYEGLSSHHPNVSYNTKLADSSLDEFSKVSFLSEIRIFTVFL